MAELQRRGKREWKSGRRKDDGEGVGGEKERNRERERWSFHLLVYSPKAHRIQAGPGLS